MATIKKKTTVKPVAKNIINVTETAPPDQLTTLQLTPVRLSLRNEFKAYCANSPYKTMPEFFEAMFEEYKQNHS